MPFIIHDTQTHNSMYEVGILWQGYCGYIRIRIRMVPKKKLIFYAGVSFGYKINVRNQTPACPFLIWIHLCPIPQRSFALNATKT